MKTTERFDKAITKLYNAFHEGKLDAGDCEFCAVGSLCDNNIDWGAFTGWSESKIGVLYDTNDDSAIEAISVTGYSPLEIVTIEKVFLNGMEMFSYDSIGEVKQTKELQFKGLCAVVSYLCELDGIEDVMNIQSLFEYEYNKPKKQLSEVL